MALIGTAASAQTPAPAQLGLIGKPIWIRKPSGQDITAMRPGSANERTPGGAILDCTATAAGALGGCKVVAEAPKGHGFGAAALKLAALYRMAPTAADGQPTAGAKVRVPVTFDARRVGGAMSLMNYPVWIHAPSLAAVEAAYPASAGGAPGLAVVRCAFDVEGRATDCELKSESPAGKGFGAVALTLTDDFVVQHAPEDADILPGVIVDIPIALHKPPATDTRLPQPQWTNALTAAAAEEMFPAPARQARVMAGTGTVDCLVSVDGRLDDCRVTREQPLDLGFGDAALRASKLMVMNPWSDEGETFAGRRLIVPIRLRLVDPNRQPTVSAGGVASHFELK